MELRGGAFQSFGRRRAISGPCLILMRSFGCRLIRRKGFGCRVEGSPQFENPSLKPWGLKRFRA